MKVIVINKLRNKSKILFIEDNKMSFTDFYLTEPTFFLCFYSWFGF